MAPSSAANGHLDLELEDIIHSLYALMLQTYETKGDLSTSSTSSTATTLGSTSSRPMVSEVQHLVRKLQVFSRSARGYNVSIPPDVIGYVENGRNPDIYTREFVEDVQRLNQLLKGKSEAFEQFGTALAAEIRNGMPEIASDVDRVASGVGWSERSGQQSNDVGYLSHHPGSHSQPVAEASGAGTAPIT